jgi:serine/threonine protein kinase
MPRHIDLNYTKWDSCKENYINYTNIQVPEVCPNVEELKLSTRIGSDSSNAEIYLYVQPEDTQTLFALKIMPVYKFNKCKVLKEIEISKLLSDYTSTSSFTGYPMLFCSQECKNVVYSTDSKFKSKPNLQTSYLMLFEKLSFDFNQLIHSIPEKTNEIPSSKNIILTIIIQVLKIVDNLNNTHGIYHRDLHLRNIMLRCKSSENIEVVIIDFGEACELPKIRNDVWTFFFNLVRSEELRKVCPEIYSKVQNVFTEYNDNIQNEKILESEKITKVINMLQE